MMQTKHTFLIVGLFLLAINRVSAQELVEQTLLHDGETREYSVYIPANYDGDIAMPLLFNFHGGNGDITSHIALSDMGPIADTAGFIIVYPQALPDPNANNATLWTHKEPTTVDDIYFVEAMIDVLAEEYMIDESRVYACGYSNGGEFTFELACRLSERIAAVGVVARSMYINTYDICAPSHPTAVLTIHGTNDDYEGITWDGTVYYVSLDEVNSYWSNYNNTDTSPTVTALPNTNTNDGSTVEHHAWNNGDGCVSVEHFKVLNGGHDWPGTFGNMDIDSDIEIWNFVSKYNLDGLIDCDATSAEEAIRQEIMIYPNPVNNQIFIEMDFENSQTYQVYSTTGQLVLVGKIDANNQSIDLTPLPADVYFLNIGNKPMKFVKMK